MKVLVCGGRYFFDAKAVYAYLDKLLATRGVTEVIHGGSNGADKLAGMWAYDNMIHCVVYPAEWDKHGKSAGYVRNSQMLNDGKPDLVVAFPGGKGTAMMVKIARAAHVEVATP